jgi:HEAT repeat protein
MCRVRLSSEVLTMTHVARASALMSISRLDAAWALVFTASVALLTPGDAGAGPNLPASLNKPRVKRIDTRSEEELRNQLAAVPEISLSRDEFGPIVEKYAAHYNARQIGRLEPTPLLTVRPDFKQLPIRRGAYSRISRREAAELVVLSQKLKTYLAVETPQDRMGRRPDAGHLRDKMSLENRGFGPEWLRPAAVPVLLQQLGHEDQPIRLMLVELLKETPGKEASQVLARRAVFDLSAAVREAAVAALVKRPREDYRDVLLYGLDYPWAPAADHAAEALVALQDRDAVPAMVNLLQKPEPNTPYQSKQNRMVVHEMVRLAHLANCLMCHPPAITLSDPVPGVVPGAVLVTSGSTSGYGGFSLASLPQVRPLWVRADVAFLRQDFAIQLRPPIAQAGLAAPADIRTDFMVRERPLSEAEIKRYKTASGPEKTSEQRRVLLSTLRELSGKNLGNSFEDWKGLAPQVDPDAEANALADRLLKGPATRRRALLVKLRDGKGAAYTEALAMVVANLSGTARQSARDALAARLVRLPVDALRDQLFEDNNEIQRAAVLASGRKKDKSLIPDLIAMIGTEDGEIAHLASQGLKTMTGQDFGPAAKATTEQRESAAQAWEAWWDKQAQSGQQ